MVRQMYYICNNGTLRSIYLAYFHSIASYGIIWGEIPPTVRRYSPYRIEYEGQSKSSRKSSADREWEIR